MSSAAFTLYHHPFDAPSRRVRLVLAEKNVDFQLVVEKPWAPSQQLLELTPDGQVPVLTITEDDQVSTVADAQAICEFLDETCASPSLLGKDPYMRAEVRRMIAWFDHKFYAEVTGPLVGEKGYKRLSGTGEPDSLTIRTACHNIRGHLEYIAWLTERRNWLAGDELSFADLAAGAHLSVIDYLGDVPWDAFALAKEWYARLKSRPCFRGLLGDHVAGFLPPRHYADLDF